MNFYFTCDVKLVKYHRYEKLMWPSTVCRENCSNLRLNLLILEDTCIGLPVYHWSILAEELKSVFCDITGRDMSWIRLQNRYCMLVQSLSLNFPIWVYPRIHDGSVTLKRFLIGKDRTRSGTIMRRTTVDSMNEIAHFRQAFFWC